MVKFSTVHYWLTECFKKEKKKLLLSELLLKSTSSNLWHEVVRETALSNILIALILERTVKTICPFFPHNEVVVLYMQKGKFSQKRVKLQCFKSSTVRCFPLCLSLLSIHQTQVILHEGIDSGRREKTFSWSFESLNAVKVIS